MTIKTNIEDPLSERTVKVTEDHALLVAEVPAPPPDVGTPSVQTLYSQYCTDDGTSTGSNDMTVNGSSTPKEFYIPAGTDHDIYLTGVVIWMIDDSVIMKKFGNITGGLTNGVDAYVIQNGQQNNVMTSVKTTVEIVQYAGGQFQVIQAASSNDDGFVAPIYFPVKLRLGIGSLDKFVVKINDDLTSLVEFTAFCTGYRQG